MKKLKIEKEIWKKIQALRTKVFEEYFGISPYDYQKEVSDKIIWNALCDTGETIAVEQSRQSGKTEGVTLSVVFLLLFYYPLKRQLGFWEPKELQIGIFAPQQEQAKTDFTRIKSYLDKIEQSTFKTDYSITENNGNTIILAGTKYPNRIVYCFSASPTSRTESKTLNIIILEESHELLDSKIDNTIMPMGAQTAAMVVYIGTAGYKQVRFKSLIDTLPSRNIILIDYKRAIRERNKKYKETKNPIHLNYKKHIDSVIKQIGMDSDAFRTQYALQWVLERGQFITEKALMKLERKDNLPEYVGPGEVCYAGIDWGKQNDSTVLVVVDDKCNLRGCLEIQGDDYNSQILMIVEVLEKVFPGCRKVHCDSTGSQDQGVDVLRARVQERRLKAQVIPVNFTPNNKDVMYKHLWSLMHDKVIPDNKGGVIVIDEAKFTFPNGQSIWKEKFLLQFLNLQKEIRRGMWSCHHPDGNYHDDFCFVADTKVLTDKGQIPIEKLRVGDKVMTRMGFKRINNIGNRKAKVIKNLGLVGTSNHPIILKDRIERLINVNVSDTIYIWNQKQLCIEEKSIIDTQILKEDIYECTTGNTINGKNLQHHYIETFGKILMVKSQITTLCIIKMVIPLIIKLKIWKLLKERNIYTKYINGMIKEKEKLLKDLEFMLDLKHENGMVQKRGENGIKNSIGKVWRKLRKENMSVIFVEKLMNQPELNKLNTVQIAVDKKIILLKTDKLESVNYVKKNSIPINIQKLDFVQIDVQPKVIGVRKVYNISVEECNEYFANNILVHNCDGLALACLAFGGLSKPYKPSLA